MDINIIIENIYDDIIKKHKIYKASKNTDYKSELDVITNEINDIFSRAAILMKKNLFDKEYLSIEELDDLKSLYLDIEKYKRKNQLDNYQDDLYNLMHYILYRNQKLINKKLIYNDVSNNLSSYTKSLSRF
jgi:hypothetical protein